MSHRQNPHPSSYNLSPEAPINNSAHSDSDYQIAEFDDQNDEDTIYVRWSAVHKRAYMYSELDRPTQWVLPNWTIRKTIEVGMGMGQCVDEYDFEVSSNFIIIHRERLDQEENPIMVTHDPDNDDDWISIQRILNCTWEPYAANKIMFIFNVR